MYFTKFEKEYLPAVAQLEASSYPQEIAQGVEGFEKNMQKQNFCYLSVAGFSKGKLVCYVAAYQDESRDRRGKACIYISDINCPNPVYLKRLLFLFCTGAEEDCGGTPPVFSAHMRSCSYRLLQGEKKRRDRRITVLEEEWLPEYYLNGEGAYRVKFMVDHRMLLRDSWKDRFQLWMDQASYHDRKEILQYAFQGIDYYHMAGEELYEEKNKRFVLNCIKESVLDYYAMFPSQIPIKILKELSMWKTGKGRNGMERYEKTIKTYQSYGYTEKGGEKQYYYLKRSGCLYVSSKSKASYTRYPEQLSGVRWFWKQQMRLWEKKRVHVSYFNRYGVRHDLIKVPYLTEPYYLFLVGRMCFIQKMTRELEESCDEEELKCFRVMCNQIYYLLSGKEARECIQGIMSRRKASKPNYFHDWKLCVSALAEAKHLLTAGAVKRILAKSYNQALGMSKCVDSVLQVIELAKKIRAPFDIKALRKEFSSRIRRDQDCVAYVNHLYYEKESKYRSRLRLPVSQEKKILEFVERMKRYNPTITFYSIFQEFGAKILKEFISGTYPCIFAPQEISLPYPQVGDYVKGVLEQRTRRAKRLYQSLRKEGLLPAALDHEMTREQCGKILEILKFHNLLEKASPMRKRYDLKIIVEPKGSPEFLAAGDATVCCMSFGSEKAKIYAEEKGFGILNVYYRGRVIANSVIWINEPYQCLVLDNIEVHPNYTKHHEILEECFLTAARKLTEQYGLNFAVQGDQYNDLLLYDNESQVLWFAVAEPAEVKTEYFYTDAMRSRVIFQKIPGEEVKTLEADIWKKTYGEAA